ncbi:unnamed protein product [Caenorhabditis brenneri]
MKLILLCFVIFCFQVHDVSASCKQELPSTEKVTTTTTVVPSTSTAREATTPSTSTEPTSTLTSTTTVPSTSTETSTVTTSTVPTTTTEEKTTTTVTTTEPTTTVPTTTTQPTTTMTTTTDPPTTTTEAPTTVTTTTEPTTTVTTTTELPTTESTSTSTETTTRTEPSTSTITSTASESTTPQQLVAARALERVLLKCPDGFPDNCTMNCGCIDVAVDNERIQEIEPTFLEREPGKYIKPTLAWSECKRVSNVLCAPGSKAYGLIVWEENGKMELDSGWNSSAFLNEYSCNNTVWSNAWQKNFNRYLYFTCKSQ